MLPQYLQGEVMNNVEAAPAAAGVAAPLVVPSEPVSIVVDEKLMVVLNKDGGVESMEVNGGMALQVLPSCPHRLFLLSPFARELHITHWGVTLLCLATANPTLLLGYLALVTFRNMLAALPALAVLTLLISRLCSTHAAILSVVQKGPSRCSDYFWQSWQLHHAHAATYVEHASKASIQHVQPVIICLLKP